VDIVVPSCAVPLTVIVLPPTLSGMLWLAAPDVTSVPLTRTVAKAFVVLGVTVIDEVALGTLAL
jgi:hypothetical protein